MLYQQDKPKEKQKKHTIADWEALPERPKYELIDGDLVMLAQPATNHQAIGRELIIEFGSFLRRKQCQVFYETSIRLMKKNNRTAFTPDIIVVCDPKKIKDNYIVGPPDLAIEIQSPSTVKYDRLLKLDRYQFEGVREYWLVDPVHCTVEVFCWEKSLAPSQYCRTDSIKVSVIDDCVIDLNLIFPDNG